MSEFNWQNYHSYRVFDEFIQRFMIERKSYVTDHEQTLDFPAALEEIQKRFVAAFDESKASFEDKVSLQFDGASENAKLFFTNVEYLWAMPMGNISPKTKASYAGRWFDEDNLPKDGARFFFVHPHTIANPGMWYLTNKYWELIAILRIIRIVTQDGEPREAGGLKRRIEELCYEAIYREMPRDRYFPVNNRCGAHAALLHLCNPEKYESIISEHHKKQILAVFEPVLADGAVPDCDEEKIKLIRSKLYGTTAPVDVDDRKYRWFFYTEEIRSSWIDKKTKRGQRAGYVTFEIRQEETAGELEGEKSEFIGYRLLRSSALVAEAKKRDNFSCLSCGFHFDNQIVQVHHLDPLSERKEPRKTTLDDLITLCPNCHYLAHFFLRQSTMNKKREFLLRSLKSLTRRYIP